MPKTTRRLTSQDWLRAGLHALANAGPEALKAEPLARALGTTKGSFYWHFQNVPDYHTRLLLFWKDGAVAALSRAAAQSLTPTERLHRIAEAIAPDIWSETSPSPETAIRAWALHDPQIAAFVAEVDAARSAYIRATLEALGLTNPDFTRLLHGALLGMGFLGGSARENESALSSLTAALLALQEA